MEYTYDLIENNEYTAIVNSIVDGRYQIINGGYGIFIDEQSSTRGLNLKNVLTNKSFNKDELIKQSNNK